MPYFEPQRTTSRADAAFLHAAERRDLASGFGRDDALVDSGDAVFEPLGDAPNAADVAAVEIGGGPPSLGLRVRVDEPE